MKKEDGRKSKAFPLFINGKAKPNQDSHISENLQTFIHILVAEGGLSMFEQSKAAKSEVF